MRDYQVQGLNWMASLHHNGINGILADEMVSSGLSSKHHMNAHITHTGFGKDTADYCLPWLPQVSPRDSWTSSHRRSEIDARQLVKRGGQVGTWI